MEANTAYALIAATISIICLSFLLGATFTKMQMMREVIRLKKKVHKLKLKLRKNG